MTHDSTIDDYQPSTSSGRPLTDTEIQTLEECVLLAEVLDGMLARLEPYTSAFEEANADEPFFETAPLPAAHFSLGLLKINLARALTGVDDEDIDATRVAVYSYLSGMMQALGERDYT